MNHSKNSTNSTKNSVVTHTHSFRAIDWRPFTSNTLCGFFKLELPSGLILCDCSYHTKGDAKWVGLPAKSFETKTGEKSWIPLVEFTSKEARKKFQDLALEALDLALVDYYKHGGGERL